MTAAGSSLLDAGALPRAAGPVGGAAEGGQGDRARLQEEVVVQAEDRRAGGCVQSTSSQSHLDPAAGRDPLVDHPGPADAPARRLAQEPSRGSPVAKYLSARRAAPSA